MIIYESLIVNSVGDGGFPMEASSFQLLEIAYDVWVDAAEVLAVFSYEGGSVFVASALPVLTERLPVLELFVSLFGPLTLVGVAAGSVEEVGSTCGGNEVAEAPLLSGKIGAKKRIQETNNMGPIIFKSFFAPSLTIGILNNPKSVPEK